MRIVFAPLGGFSVMAPREVTRVEPARPFDRPARQDQDALCADWSRLVPAELPLPKESMVAVSSAVAAELRRQGVPVLTASEAARYERLPGRAGFVFYDYPTSGL